MKRLFLLLLWAVFLSVPVHAQLFRIGMISQDPDPIHTGDVVEVDFKIENLWEESKYDVAVEVVPEYPFSVYGESPIEHLGRIDGTKLGRDAVYFDFKLRVDQDAVDGEHEITLLVHDGENTLTFENMFYIDVEKELIKLSPYIIDSDLVTGGKKGSFTIEIANSGGINAEALELELLPSEDYRLLSTSNYLYLGDLEADDAESEDFDIYVDKGVTEVHVPVRLNYEADDKPQSREFDLVLNLLSEKEAKEIGLATTNYTPYAVIAVVLIIIGLIIWKRRSR